MVNEAEKGKKKITIDRTNVKYAKCLKIILACLTIHNRSALLIFFKELLIKSRDKEEDISWSGGTNYWPFVTYP